MATWIGIPLFGTEVSPRFCFAETMLLVEVDKGKALRRLVVSLGDPWLPRRVAGLATYGVRTLLCGAFHRAFMPTAKRLGIRVITGVSGNAEDVLARFLCGQIAPANGGNPRCQRAMRSAK